jgi:DNA-binding response OmpR family regulator
MGTILEDYEVWVIDDEEQILRSTKTSLELAGYKVRVFSDPVKTGSELKECDKFVLLILDHDFSNSEQPSYTGYDLAKLVKTEYFLGRSAPIIYLTGRETKANFVAMQGEFPHV